MVAEQSAQMLAREPIKTERTPAFVSDVHPLGVVLAVNALEFRRWQVFRFGRPALMCRPDAALLKHRRTCPGLRAGDSV